MNQPSLGPYLVALREARGWSLTDAALRIGMSKSHLSQLEGGKIGLPSAGLRRQIAHTYGVRHIDILVAAGELSADEIAPRPEPVPFDSERAVVLSLIPHLEETEAGIVNATVRALIRAREERRLARHESTNGTTLLAPA